MKDEIKQNGETVLSSTDGISTPMLFNNLSGKNFSDKEYRDYILNIAYPQMGFVPGKISLHRNGELIREAEIPDLQ